MASKQSLIPKTLNSISQGDCIHLRNNKNLFQVVGIDNKHQKCWVRQWPLLEKGCPVFEISIQQVELES